MSTFINKKKNILIAVIYNILLSYALLAACRIIFVIVNHNYLADSLAHESTWHMIKGALLFDTATVCYLNIPYILITLLPLHYKESAFTDKLSRLIYVCCNSIGIIANICDIVYVPFTGRRTTWSVFSEFSNEDNLFEIIGTEVVSHWYLVLPGIAFIWLAGKLYTTARYEDWNLPRYYISRSLLLVISAMLMVAGMRGGIDRTTRPITLNDANRFINDTKDAAVVLTTPFTMIRTIGKKPFREINYFPKEKADRLFTPLQQFTHNDTIKNKNVVIFILESWGKEYIGALNPDREEDSRTPFLDSIIAVSHTYARSYGNGRKSIDGMPSVLSGIPMFVEPFFVTPASLNKVSGIAGELGKSGYHSAFFHGAPNGSMGFQAFAKASGFKEYYGKDEFDNSPQYNSSDDFDGTWAIWDEPFFRFYAESMNNMPQPFVTAMFSASSHHPFKLPLKYEKQFKPGKTELSRCIEYTDYALKQFFETAKNSDWFKNTLFVFTADHSNKNTEPRYKTSSGYFEVPIIFYTPECDTILPAGIDSTHIAQQIDIMPTILDYLGHNKPFVAFGKSLIRQPAVTEYAVNYINGMYQYYSGDYILQFDGEKKSKLYNIKDDILMNNDLLTAPNENASAIANEMQEYLKAIIQQYMSCMTNDKLVPENYK